MRSAQSHDVRTNGLPAVDTAGQNGPQTRGGRKFPRLGKAVVVGRDRWSTREVDNRSTPAARCHHRDSSQAPTIALGMPCGGAWSNDKRRKPLFRLAGSTAVWGQQIAVDCVPTARPLPRPAVNSQSMGVASVCWLSKDVRRGDPGPLPARQLKRRGMSLMELLLVLALLSTVVAISWPALRRPLNRSQAQAAAQQVQRDLMKARRAAMESGQVYLFQYYPESTRYYCGTVRQRDGGDAPVAWTDPDEMTADGESADGDWQIDGELPVGSSFRLSGDSFSDVSTRINASREQSLSSRDDRSAAATGDAQDRRQRSSSDGPNPSRNRPESLGGTSSRWTRPWRFYPSGRMESGQLTVASDDGYDIVVEIQGLAGRVKIHPPERRTESDSENMSRSDQNSSSRPSKSSSDRTAPTQTRPNGREEN